MLQLIGKDFRSETLCITGYVQEGQTDRSKQAGVDQCAEDKTQLWLGITVYLKD